MDKAARPVRNRRNSSRRAWPPGDANHRLQKRLFTPEIKRMLKDWLVRRRDNPYPSRDEKKTLAVNSGLTYIQICNWFANWRRKLKNAGREPSKRTWGNLIKNYNTSANGNVEQFSISSNDSIWGDETEQRAASSSGLLDHRQHQHHHHRYQQMCLQPAAQFHPDYRPMTFEASGQPVMGAEHQHNNGSRTIEYYDRFGELVIRTTAAGVSGGAGVMMAQPAHHATYMSDNVAMRDGYCYGYYGSAEEVPVNMEQEQCFQISSTTPIGLNNNHLNVFATTTTSFDAKPPTTDATANHLQSQPSAEQQATHKPPSTNGSTAKYKSNIMEKYLRDLQPDAFVGKDPIVDDGKTAIGGGGGDGVGMGNNGGRELSKWLESAANFTPDKKNYIEWEGGVRIKDPKSTNGRTTSECPSDQSSAANHEREELEAAEALTSLAGNYRNRMFGTLATLARP